MSKITYLDCDGVLLDSNIRLYEIKDKCGFPGWDNESFLKFFDYSLEHLELWDYILNDAQQINDSLDIVKEVERRKKIVILTKVHLFYEMELKTKLLRDKYKITSDIIFVPPNISKSKMVIPNGNVLVDDQRGNIKSWRNAGGKGILFDPSLEKNEKGKARSLEFLNK